MFKGFTNRCRKIINQYTITEANRYNHTVIQPEHILIAMLKEGQSNAYTVMSEIIDLIHFQFILESHISKMSDDTPTNNLDILLYYNISLDIQISERSKHVIQNAINEARRVGAKQVDTFSLFLASCEEEASISQAIIMRHEVLLDDLREQYYNYIKAQDKKNQQNSFSNNKTHIADDVTYQKPENQSTNNYDIPEINNIRFNKLIKDLDIHSNSFENNNSIKKTHSQKKEEESNIPHPNMSQKSKSPQKQEYLQDLTVLVQERNQSHIYGRNDEIEQVFRVLLRKQKNNPILVGDSGVGKTAIVEEIALRIAEGNVPMPLLGAEVLQLGLAELTAGTRYRGDFEERLLGVIDELEMRKRNNHRAILFIDEFHHIIGAGLANGLSMDGAGILKPALARGDICCIGITTAEEYRKHIEADKAFLRRLQKIDVSEMSDYDTFLTLNKIKSEYEERHNVSYSEESLHEIIRLAKNYIFDRKFPDKAIDLLDEIGAYNQLKNFETPKELVELYQKEIELSSEIRDEINKFKDDATFGLEDIQLDKANELQEITERKHNLQKTINNNFSKNTVDITPESVREIVTLSTGIPSDRLDSSKSSTIAALEEGLSKNIIGQDKAIDSLISAVKRSSVGLHLGNRPIGSFMFLGPTGVGKTYTAKQLAYYLFGREDSVTRFDMSDFSESNSINRLIGAPPGYVGYEESGVLINLIRRNPHQLLLFDEIEKAHNKIFDMFLQILEEGKLQSHTGESADFRHCIIVMTSNIGSKELLSKKNFGFNADLYESNFVSGVVHEELSQHFRPELINRFDEFIIFDPLGNKEIKHVIDLMLQELVQTLSLQKIDVVMQESTKQFLFEKFYQVEYGARSIRRGLRIIENLIAEYMIDNNITNGDTIRIGIKNNNLKVTKSSQSNKTKQTASKVLTG